MCLLITFEMISSGLRAAVIQLLALEKNGSQNLLPTNKVDQVVEAVFLRLVPLVDPLETLHGLLASSLPGSL